MKKFWIILGIVVAVILICIIFYNAFKKTNNDSKSNESDISNASSNISNIANAENNSSQNKGSANAEKGSGNDMTNNTTSQKYSDELNAVINDYSKPVDKLLTVTYSRNGGMEDVINEYEIDASKMLLIRRNADGVGADVEVKEYSISQDELNELTSMIKEYNFTAWKNFPADTDDYALDAPTTSIDFTYDNTAIGGRAKAWYSISFNTQIPSDGVIILKAFINKITVLEKEENLSKEYTKERE